MKLPVKTMSAGGYRYIPFEFQYSSGIQALPGYRLVRVTFDQILPLEAGFDRIQAHLLALGLPLQAFAACELRSPKPFDAAGFRAFNVIYAGTLAKWGITDGDDNPIARSNVCPLVHGPDAPGFYAFTYAVPDATLRSVPSFLIAGGAETRDVFDKREDQVVEYRNISEQGIFNKGIHTLGEMERRLAAFDLTWKDTSAVHVYSVHDFHRLAIEQMAPRGVLRNGLTWQLCRPPVVDIEFEMDCRGIDEELMLTVD